MTLSSDMHGECRGSKWTTPVPGPTRNRTYRRYGTGELVTGQTSASNRGSGSGPSLDLHSRSGNMAGPVVGFTKFPIVLALFSNPGPRARTLKRDLTADEKVLATCVEVSRMLIRQ